MARFLHTHTHPYRPRELSIENRPPRCRRYKVIASKQSKHRPTVTATAHRHDMGPTSNGGIKFPPL